MESPGKETASTVVPDVNNTPVHAVMIWFNSSLSFLPLHSLQTSYSEYMLSVVPAVRDMEQHLL